MVLATRDIEKVLVSVKRGDLASVDAFNRMVCVAELALRGESPARREILLLALLLLLTGNLLLLLLSGSMQIFLRHLVLLLLLHSLTWVMVDVS